MRPGQSFESKEVAEHYRYRPDYPAGLFTKLVELSPRSLRALDLGCGTGKVARQICKTFGSVTAVDASASMLEVAQALQHKSDNNITWICGRAEETKLVGDPFDLIVAAASIHWMDHSVLFPRLLNHVDDDYVFAVVDGDGAYQPPWQDAWDDFLSKWIFELLGERYEPNRRGSNFAKKMTRHKAWLSLAGEASFEHNVSQSVDDFISCQYSRDTFAPSKLGRRMGDFSEDLRQVVSPYADSADMLGYRVQTRVEWGKIQQAVVK